MMGLGLGRRKSVVDSNSGSSEAVSGITDSVDEALGSKSGNIAKSSGGWGLAEFNESSAATTQAATAVPLITHQRSRRDGATSASRNNREDQAGASDRVRSR